MREQLEETIRQLQKQLTEAENINSDEATELKDALEEITASLDEQGISSATLAERLQEQTQSFQDSHPVLTQTVGRMADMLAQMGI